MNKDPVVIRITCPSCGMHHKLDPDVIAAITCACGVRLHPPWTKHGTKQEGKKDDPPYALKLINCAGCGFPLQTSPDAIFVECPKCSAWTDPDTGKLSKYDDCEKPALKHDELKIRFDLISPKPIAALARVLTHGANKYAPWDWKKVVTKNPERYVAALHRHINAWQTDPTQKDEETGESHLAHAMCCIVFLMELEK